MRLVDIEPIVELVKGEHEKVQNRFNEANVIKEPKDVALWGAVLQEVGAFIGLMINAPTVDAVPVIRCKDCIHRYSTCPMITIHPTGSISFRAQDDWFCFMGEGKKNERVHCQRHNRRV